MNIFSYVNSALFSSGADVFSIGKSELNRDILCAHVGRREGKQIIVTAAIHARECYTALVALDMLAFPPTTGGAYVIPLVNPDGALFFESGDTGGSKFLSAHISEREVWKANANGVDLNCNFPARFGTGKSNVFTPSAQSYVGKRPLCAAESRALALFTLSVKPAVTLSYHCMGGELYWQFYQNEVAARRDSAFAAAVAEHIGVKKVDGELNSAGGYKDWCVSALDIPAFTVELIKSGSHPFAPAAFDGDRAKNRDMLRFLSDYIWAQEERTYGA